MHMPFHGDTDSKYIWVCGSNFNRSSFNHGCTNRQTNRETDRQIERETDRLFVLYCIDKCMYTHTYIDF